MSYIPKKGTSGIIWSRKVVTVVKQPAGTGIGCQVLIGKGTLPPAEILYGLKSRRQKRIGIRLDETVLIKRRIAFILEAPIPPVDQPGECIGPVPFAQFDPSFCSI